MPPVLMARYVALLRGINVGGKNPIGMPALKACFEEHGFEDVATYIQSGNVLFSARRASMSTFTSRIERMLSADFDYDARRRDPRSRPDAHDRRASAGGLRHRPGPLPVRRPLP